MKKIILRYKLFIIINLFIFIFLLSCNIQKINRVDKDNFKIGKWVVQSGDSTFYFTYKKGLLNGKFKFYLKSNLISKGNYKNGEQNGEWIYYFDNPKGNKVIFYEDGSVYRKTDQHGIPFKY
jgi:hypothetical protein